MEVLAPLAAGITAAPNGTATVYLRGTTTPAQVFNAFEGGSLFQSHIVSLDSNGGVEAYVDALVDVTVRDVDGNSVRVFTAGRDLRSQAFTGQDYDDQTPGIGLPIDYDSIFAAWLTSAGAPDWKVDIGGVGKTLQSALAPLEGFYRNVKDPAYGAAGNGVTDDSSAIQLAMDAGSGVLFFPAGTYRITSKLITGSKDITFVGTGRTSTILRMDSASEDAVHCNPSGGTGALRIKHMTLDHQQSCTGSLVLAGGSGSSRCDVVLDDCDIGGPTLTASGAVVELDESASSGFMQMNNCKVLAGPSATALVKLGDCLGGNFSDCRFELPPRLSGLTQGIFNSGSSTARIRVEGCLFDASGVNGGGAEAISHAVGGTVSAHGNDVEIPALGTFIMFQTGSKQLIESGNENIGATMYSVFGTANVASSFGSRSNRVSAVSSGSTSFSVDVTNHEVIDITYTGTNTSPTVTLATAGIPYGSRLSISFTPTSVGAPMFPTFNGALVPGGVSDTILLNEKDAYDFVLTSSGWVQTGSTAGNVS